MRFITIDDIIDTYAKLKQRGLSFITSKLNPYGLKRTKSAFNELEIQASNFWIIPKILKRWNKKITGDENMEYEEYVMLNYFRNKKNLRMLSIGSGACDHELKFAKYSNFEEIRCIDINNVLFDAAKENAKKLGLKNIIFQIQNIYDYKFPENYYDIVFFHASLHHFKDIDEFVGTTLKTTLKDTGKLIIHEFVGATRLQFPKYQLRAINKSLELIPKKFKKRFKLGIYKNRVYGSGIIRMILADPSECIESSSIIPSILKHYKPIYEAPLGGNILMTALKDISHHFVELTPEKEKILFDLFAFEDSYLKKHSSDFVFGVYQIKE